jgi:hypothetical protein
MNLYTVKNNETGETRGLDLNATVDTIYFDAVIDNIRRSPGEYTGEDAKDLLTKRDKSFHAELRCELSDLENITTYGRFEVTPLI